MFSLSLDGMELGLAVALLSLKWLFITVFAYLVWYRFLREKLIKPDNRLLKLAIIIALAAFLTLIILSGFFATVQHTLEVTYEFPVAFVYRFY